MSAVDGVQTIHETSEGDALLFDPSDSTYRITYTGIGVSSPWLSFSELCELLEVAKYHHLTSLLK